MAHGSSSVALLLLVLLSEEDCDPALVASASSFFSALARAPVTPTSTTKVDCCMK